MTEIRPEVEVNQLPRDAAMHDILRRRLLICGLVLAALMGGGGCGARPRRETARPDRAAQELRAAANGANIVLCIIDAARADHVGCYGYPRDTTPNIDRIAEQGFVFERHFVQFPETKPSTASLFTGQFPDTHLAYGPRTIDPNTFTLAKGLKQAGYHTALFSQNGYASPMWGLGTEFDEAYYEPHLKKAGRDLPDIWRPEALLELIAPWLRKGPRTPFFMYVHLMPPHDPYLAPPATRFYFMGKEPPGAWESDYPFPEVETELRRKQRPWLQAVYLNSYDGNLRYADGAVAELQRLLRESGHLEDTILIITSDHGEAFGEHGYRGHTFSAFDETIHVPLVMKLPSPSTARHRSSSKPGKRIAGLTESVDLLPTLLDLLGIGYPRDSVQGRSLLPLVTGESSEVNEYVFARTAGDPPSYIVRDKDSLLVLYEGARLRACYDLRKDPRALSNTLGHEPERAASLTEAFRAFARAQRVPPLHFVDPGAPPAQLPEVNEVQMNEEMRRSLKALGYLK